MIIILHRAVFSIKINPNRRESFKNNEKKKTDYCLSEIDRPLFDISYFKQDRRNIGDEVKMMLKMAPEKRTNDHIKLICVSLRDHVPLFQEFPINIQNSIAKVANLQEIEENRVIIRENQIAHNYYFIVSGVGP